ncbi:MAG: hypothetical protein AABW75_01225 [Nanoarchaeota archaeon]
MVNRKGWVRIVEATIMILLIMSVLVIVNRERKIKSGLDIDDLLYKTLDEIAKDDQKRNQIITSPDNMENSFNSFLNGRIPINYLSYDFEICSSPENANDNCNLAVGKKQSAERKDIFTSERIIGGYNSQGTFTIKKIKIYVWVNYQPMN